VILNTKDGTHYIMDKEEINVLRNVPIFAELEERELEKIAKLGVRQKYKKGMLSSSSRKAERLFLSSSREGEDRSHG